MYLWKYIYNIGVLTVNIEFMWRGLETGERRAFSESFHPFRAEPHKLYIYRQCTNIVFTQLQLSICLLFFLFCYFTLYIVVLTLKIGHCLVFISIKLSYLILITLSILIKYVSSKPIISCKSRRFLSKAPKTGHFPIDKIMYRGYYACTYERILGALLGKPLLLLNDVICMFAILITDSADSKKA
jgi:hypothetical protein